MIKCVCGDKKCPINVVFDDASHIMWFTNKANDDYPMYFDPNTTIALINRLKKFLQGFYENGNEV